MMRTFKLCLLFLMCIVTAFAQTAPQESQECADAKAQVARLQTRFQDWPALARYRDANAGVSAPAKDEKRVVFMGDSITDGWKLATYFPSKPYINRGISGQTTPQMLIRFRPDVIALKPQVVVILAGTNDLAGNTGAMSLEAIEANLTSMFELARANNIRVVIASVLPVSDYAKNREGKPIIQTTRRPPEKIKALNEWAKKYAADNGLTYLDYFSATVDEKGFLKEELSGDGLHPNDKGYVVMQPLAEQAIAAALKKRK
ncbi:MAG TPA: SGNH/GDSL hydrolase family protein [Blastocatellia bacterium]|nr:SGNH/GDSL hydrolase family protein [Blastocatellia bacterium]